MEQVMDNFLFSVACSPSTPGPAATTDRIQCSEAYLKPQTTLGLKYIAFSFILYVFMHSHATKPQTFVKSPT